MPPAGYLGTPLAKKPGVTEGQVVCVLGAPDILLDLLAPFPPDVMD